MLDWDNRWSGVFRWVQIFNGFSKSFFLVWTEVGTSVWSKFIGNTPTF
jgi:hypothetical protein